MVKHTLEILRYEHRNYFSTLCMKGLINSKINQLLGSHTRRKHLTGI